MGSNAPRQAELTLPASALTALSQALHTSLGPEAAADALRSAGHAAGDAFFRILTSGNDGLAGIPADRFWEHLARLFAARGWGHLTYSEAHPGVGALVAADWAEVPTGVQGAGPVCHFTTGLLANLLGQVARGEVAVLEAECRGRGDARCRFLFGGQEAVYSVYERITAGDTVDAALAGIG